MRSPRKREPRLWLAFAAAVIAAAGAAFWIPAFQRTSGHFPVPLDDVYIHFGFARSAALGHPFAWIPENGYSSGGTSLLWPLVLAPGWLLGLRGERLAWFAAAASCLAILDLARSLRALVTPRWIAWAVPPLLVAVPLLDWTLFSGMEVALFAAVLGRALRAVRAAEIAPPARRPRAQLRAGAWAALLVAARPESAPLAILLGVAAVHAAGSIRTLPSLARALGPTAGFLAAQALANRALTGEWSAAGAVRKLLFTNPYATTLETAIEVIKNLAALRSQAFEAALGGPVIAWVVPAIGVAAAIDRRSRRVAIPLLLGAVAAIALVCLNATARYQNLRYAAPSLIMLLAAAAIGAATIARRAPAIAALLLAIAILAPAGSFRRQIDHFARASANIAGQQVEVARRLAARNPRPHRVLVGDAGAIPYLSGLGAVDGLGLGGLHDLPFARASVHGNPAVVELIERLDPRDRPDVMALYPSWWPGLADVFGRPIDAVRIRDNVICGAEEKVIYDADWSALAPPGEARAGAIDTLDVADLVDERSHAYTFPGPRGGWIVGAVLALPGGARRFDAGRIVPQGASESFTARRDATQAALVIRTDGGDPMTIRAAVERGAREASAGEITAPTRAAGAWYEVRLQIGEVRAGDRVRITAKRGDLRDFHAWIVEDTQRTDR